VEIDEQSHNGSFYVSLQILKKNLIAYIIVKIDEQYHNRLFFSLQLLEKKVIAHFITEIKKKNFIIELLS
jgi:hypothetical protein